MKYESKEIEYVLMDPSKNITALVETEIKTLDQKTIADKLMKKEPLVEQVGFIGFKDDMVSLKMSGGEFCGNATMSAAVYYAMKKNVDGVNIKVEVLGSKKYVNVSVNELSNGLWQCTVDMLKVIKIEDISFLDEYIFPVVFFDGIAHVICDREIEKTLAESLIKKWCDDLDVEALGIMFIDKNMSVLKPLVYVKNVDTLFWENACASGSSAVGAWLSNKEKDDVKVSLMQPGGDRLDVMAYKDGAIKLTGTVRLIDKKVLTI